MLNYIKKLPDLKLGISIENHMKFMDITVQKYVNGLLLKQLTDIYSRERTTKKIFLYKAKVPIYINSEVFLMCINSFRLGDSLYINYFAIKKYHENGDSIIVVFYNGSCIKVTNKGAFKTQLARVKKIMNYLSKEKVFS